MPFPLPFPTVILHICLLLMMPKSKGKNPLGFFCSVLIVHNLCGCTVFALLQTKWAIVVLAKILHYNVTLQYSENMVTANSVFRIILHCMLEINYNSPVKQSFFFQAGLRLCHTQRCEEHRRRRREYRRPEGPLQCADTLRLCQQHVIHLVDETKQNV